MSHTPSPWKIRVSSDVTNERQFTVEYSDGKVRSIIARMYENAVCEEHGDFDSNVRLIASAPELLSCLKECENAFRAFLSDNICATEIHYRILKAISKAEGETK